MADTQENKHSLAELVQWQALPLNVKIQMSCYRIREWIKEYGEEGVYIAFSGGKDSTVLRHLVKEVCGFKNVPGVFSNTGLEYPEIVQFVKTFDDIEIVYPEMNFRQVIEKYGYPFITKQVSKRLYEWDNAIKKGRDLKDTEAYKEFHGEKYIQKDGMPQIKSLHNKAKWLFMTEAPWSFSHKCCDEIKKKPMEKYGKKTGRVPITAEMACESINRANNWIHYGCNAFDAKKPKSTPLVFWTEQDILLYIKKYNLEIASVYGDIVVDHDADGQLDGQMDIFDLDKQFGEFGDSQKTLKTTGCRRTGCMYCGYGCYLEPEGEGRFETMKVTHPKIYDYIMRPWEEEVLTIDSKTGEQKIVKQLGLNYKEIIDWINEHGNLNIRY